MRTPTEWVAGALAAVVAVIALGWWFSADPTSAFVEFHPGMDLPEGMTAVPVAVDEVSIGEFFESFEGVPAELSGSWPGFRGVGATNVGGSSVPLARSWPAAGPPRSWSVELGEGHAAPAIWQGRVFVLDYDEEQRADALRCFSLADGREIWRRWYRVKLKRNHGLSRTVPAVSEAAVVTVGPRGHVMAVDPESGDLLWTMDLEKDWGTTAPFWYTGQCPLIDDGVAVIAPAGAALMIGVDAISGEVLWQTPNPGDWKMSHTSVMPMTIGGRRVYVYSALGGMAGVAADGEDRGRILWQSSVWDHAVLAPSPLVLPDGRIYLTAGYGAGSMVVEVRESAGLFTVEELHRFTPEQCMASEQQTPILWKGHVFAILPRDAGQLREQLVCYDPGDWQSVVWSSGKTERFGLGPYLVVDDTMFILDDEGELTMIEASSSGFRKLARADVLDGHDAWGPMAYADGRLLVRDSRTLVCLDVSQGSG